MDKCGVNEIVNCLTFPCSSVSLMLLNSEWKGIDTLGKLYGALAGLSIIWGISFFFIKILVDELGNWGVSFWRCFFGALVLLLVMLVKKEFVRWREVPFWPVFLVGLFNNALPWGLIALSETLISSSMASFINAATPLWTMVIGSIWFSVTLTKRQWGGVFLGFAGIFVLADIKIENILSENIFGVMMMMAATICYGLGAHLSKKYLQHLSVTHISFTTLTMAAVISFVCMQLFNRTPIHIIQSSEIILALIGLGGFGSGIAYLLYYYLVKEGSAEFASLVTYIVPVSATFWGALLLDETISAHMILGLLFIFGGVYLSSYNKREKQYIGEVENYEKENRIF
jgi:drug/metabolite transporter (DMT)-like permease